MKQKKAAERTEALPDADLRVVARRAYELIREEFSQRDREVFAALVFDGSKPAEIARERGISVGAVH